MPTFLIFSALLFFRFCLAPFPFPLILFTISPPLGRFLPPFEWMNEFNGTCLAWLKLAKRQKYMRQQMGCDVGGVNKSAYTKKSRFILLKLRRHTIATKTCKAQINRTYSMARQHCCIRMKAKYLPFARFARDTILLHIYINTSPLFTFGFTSWL